MPTVSPPSFAQKKRSPSSREESEDELINLSDLSDDLHKGNAVAAPGSKAATEFVPFSKGLVHLDPFNEPSTLPNTIHGAAPGS